MSNHRNVNDDEEFPRALTSAGSKLVVVDFNATWCGPCKQIQPFFHQLATKYKNALFLGVDVDKCRETAMNQGVSAMPTFIFYRNATKIDLLKGANPVELEEKVKKHYGSEESSEIGSGISDLFQYIELKSCECLNEADSTPFRSFIESKSKLVSDCDEQLILSYGFSQNIKLQAIRIKTEGNGGPKTLKLFINQPKTLDFDAATQMTPTQELILGESDLKGEIGVEVRYVKFQSVSNLQIFIVDNQDGSEVTTIDSLTLLGSPMSTTNMTDFKRIAGKAGESH